MSDPQDAAHSSAPPVPLFSRLATPFISTPDTQDAIEFLGAVERIRVDGRRTAGELAVHEVQALRGHGSPMHRHTRASETFYVLEGELRVLVDDIDVTAGAGSAAILPPGHTHGFVVTSPTARYLTLHTPSGFDAFVRAAGHPEGFTDPNPPDPETLTRLAAQYGVEIVGPPPLP